MQPKVVKSISLINILASLLVIVAPIIAVKKVQASNLNIAMIRLDRMAASTATTGTVCARPTSTATEGKVVLTFPASFTLGTSAANWAIDTTNTSWTGSPTPSAWSVTSPVVVGQTVTFTSPDLTMGTTYCFNFNSTAAISSTGATTGALDASIETQTGASAQIDKSSIKLYILTTSDQVSVTGTVAPTFSMTLSANAAPLGTIGNSVVNASTTPNVSIVTNARNGWVAWVADANNGTLNSAGTGANIPTPGAVGSNYDLATLSANGAYGLGVTATGGSPTLAAEYNGTTAGHAGTLSSSFRPIASSTTFSSADQITLIPRAIAKTTQAPASDYTDTLTVVAAGQF